MQSKILRDNPRSHFLDSESPSAQKKYPYKPLETSRNEIRLIHSCQPPQVDGVLHCTLHHVSLDETPTYEALSYTWADENGDSTASKHISIDGHIVAVTKNLEAALRQILIGDDERILWVDAVSINQDNVLERNEQVNKMRRVYQKAHGVISWLGEDYQESRKAFKLLRSFLDIGVVKTFYDQPEPWTPDFTVPEDQAQDMLAVFNLYQRGYWMRSWIVQETAFAKSIVFYCGEDRMTWDDMKSSYGLIIGDNSFLSQSFYGTSIGHLFWMLGGGPRMVSRIDDHGPRRTLGGLLARHRSKLATDPRDKIYSILGLVSSDEEIPVPIDYDIEVPDLFRTVAKYIAVDEKDLSVLSQNKLPRVRALQGGSQLPSWVPEWANLEEVDLFRIDEASYKGPAHNLGSTFIPCVRSIEMQDILCVQGVRIGTVTAVGQLMPDFKHEKFEFVPVFETLYNWWLIFNSTGRKDATGPGGLMDILNFGMFWEYLQDPPLAPKELRDMMERETVNHLRVAFSIHKPEDKTLYPVLGKQEIAVDDKTRHQAEVDIWGVTPWCRRRRFITANGALCGVGPQCVEVGDSVVLLPRCKVPLILRKRTEGDGNGYINIGDAYLEHHMNGEIMRGIKDGLRHFEYFEVY